VSGFKITELWAWVTLDDGDGDEGVIAFQSSDGTWMPLVMADKVRMDHMRPIAEEIAAICPHPVELRRFSIMTVEDVLDPNHLLE